MAATITDAEAALLVPYLGVSRWELENYWTQPTVDAYLADIANGVPSPAWQPAFAGQDVVDPLTAAVDAFGSAEVVKGVAGGVADAADSVVETVKGAASIVFGNLLIVAIAVGIGYALVKGR